MVIKHLLNGMILQVPSSVDGRDPAPVDMVNI